MTSPASHFFNLGLLTYTLSGKYFGEMVPLKLRKYAASALKRGRGQPAELLLHFLLDWLTNQLRVTDTYSTNTIPIPIPIARYKIVKVLKRSQSVKEPLKLQQFEYCVTH
jgi:hypothetical protein